MNDAIDDSSSTTKIVWGCVTMSPSLFRRGRCSDLGQPEADARRRGGDRQTLIGRAFAVGVQVGCVDAGFPRQAWDAEERRRPRATGRDRDAIALDADTV